MYVLNPVQVIRLNDARMIRSNKAANDADLVYN